MLSVASILERSRVIRPTFRTSAALAAAGALTAALILTACGDDGEEADSGQPSVSNACEALAELHSYRYTLTVSAELGDAEPEPGKAEAEVTLNNTVEIPDDPDASTLTPTPTPDALADLSDALATLFSDFTLEGAFVEPDRSQAVLQFQDTELELRTIGAESWIRIDDRWQEGEPSTAIPSDLLSPNVVCDDILTVVSSALESATPTADAAAGVDADRYRLDLAEASDLSPLLGEVSGDYRIDLWLARDGGWPARLLIQSRDAKGKGNAFQLSMELTDVGSDEIEIEEPTP